MLSNFKHEEKSFFSLWRRSSIIMKVFLPKKREILWTILINYLFKLRPMLLLFKYLLWINKELFGQEITRFCSTQHRKVMKICKHSSTRLTMWEEIFSFSFLSLCEKTTTGFFDTLIPKLFHNILKSSTLHKNRKKKKYKSERRERMWRSSKMSHT